MNLINNTLSDNQDHNKQQKIIKYWFILFPVRYHPHFALDGEKWLMAYSHIPLNKLD